MAKGQTFPLRMRGGGGGGEGGRGGEYVFRLPL